jgi:uncharacterized protein YndB with AHSA1/START domain
MHTIENAIDIAAPTDRIIEALTTEAGYRGWFTEATTFDGKQATFSFARPEITRTQTFRVDRSDGRGVAMTCTSETNNAEWLGTTLTIAVEGGRVRLAHAGYREKNEYFEQCTQGWAYFLASLKGYVETGRGTPWPSAR